VKQPKEPADATTKPRWFFFFLPSGDNSARRSEFDVTRGGFVRLIPEAWYGKLANHVCIQWRKRQTQGDKPKCAGSTPA